MGVIATLLPNAAHVSDSEPPFATGTSWSRVTIGMHSCTLASVSPSAVAVIDIFAGGRGNFDRVRNLKKRLPRLTLIAYVDFVRERAHDLFERAVRGWMDSCSPARMTRRARCWRSWSAPNHAALAPAFAPRSMASIRRRVTRCCWR